MDRETDCRNSAELGPSLGRWLATSPGKDLVERESNCVDSLLTGLFGYYLLQVGWTREFFQPVDHCHIRHHIALEPNDPSMKGAKTIIGDECAFPLAADSVDVVLLPHTLEFSRDPHQVLRETERVLIPEGRVIILGFNPLSTWGLWRQFRRRSRSVPWCGRFISPQRVCDWLALLGFDVEVQEPVMFLPPLQRSGLLQRLEILEPAGQRWLSMFSGAYAIRAVKRVSTLTTLQPSWKSRGRMLPGRAVEPTARGDAGV